MFASIRSLIREPLLHFLLAGAGLFLLFDFVSEPTAAGDDQIIVTSGQIEHMASLFVKTWQRSPTDEELTGLIDSFILEEVLYREATAIGLDKDDTIIRRRLKQKMEFLVDDFSAADPSDVDLQQFIDGDPERFRADARITFEQVYMADPAPGAAEATLEALMNNVPGAFDSAGLSGLLPRTFEDASETSISSQFGESFGEALFAQETGKWTGPVESPFGIHLVRIEQISDGHVPPLSEIEDAVRRDWLFDRRRDAQEALFEQLRSKYSISIESSVMPDA